MKTILTGLLLVAIAYTASAQTNGKLIEVARFGHNQPIVPGLQG